MLVMECVYLISVHPLSVPTLKMAVWLFFLSFFFFAMCRRPKFREEVRCAKTVSENSGCAKQTLLIYLHSSNPTLRLKNTTHNMHYVASFPKTKHVSAAPLCPSACLFCGCVTHPSTQTDHIMSHGLARDGWRL